MRQKTLRLVFLLALAPLVVSLLAALSLRATAQGTVYHVYLPAVGNEKFTFRSTQQPPRIDVQPTTYNFGFVYIGQVATATLTIRNIGAGDLLVDRPVITPTAGSPFAISIPVDPDRGFPAVIPSQGALQATISCRPQAPTVARGTILISSNDPISPTVSVIVACRGQRSVREEKDDKPAQRFAWFDQMRTYPGTEIPPNARLQAWRQVEGLRRPPIPGPRKANEPDQLSSLWRSIGPSNISGRVSTVVVDPTNSTRLFIGGAGGGVWRSDDAGATWVAKFEQQPSLAMGSIGVTTDPVSGNTILYAGTGEANGSTSLAGVGVLISTDLGDTWTLADTTQLVDSSGNLNQYTYKIAVAPTNPRTVYVAGTRGLFQSTNPTAGWTRLNLDAAVAVENVSDVALVAGAPGHAYAAIRSRGVYSTTTSGAMWTPVFTVPAGGGRISLAAAPSNPRRVYASVQNAGGADNLEVYTSSDAGQTWSPTGFPTGQSPFHWYTSCLGVDPANDQDVYVCDLDLWRKNGGGAWTNITNAYTGGPTDWLNNRPHPDHHALAFGPLSMGQRALYIGNDGGLYRSTDTGATWQWRSQGLALMEFTDIGITPGDPNLVGGGAQDQGSNATNAPPNWTNIRDSDGGYVVFDPVDPNIRYSESQNLGIGKTTTGGEPWSGATSGIAAPDPRPWVGVIVMDPNDRNTLYTGTDRVYKSTTAAGNWVAQSMGHNVCIAANTLGTSANPVTITIQVESTADGPLGFTGSGSNNDGAARLCNSIDEPFGLANSQTLVITTQVGANPATQEVITFLSGQFANIAQATAAEVVAAINGGASNFNAWRGTAGQLITAIAVAPSNSQVVYAGTMEGEIWKTVNGGTTWTDVTARTGGGVPMPNRWVTRLAVDPTDPQRVYKLYSGYNSSSNLAGHIFRSNDGGATWPDNISPRDLASVLIDIPFNSIAVDPTNPDILYAAADLGLFRTINGGATWTVVMDGLPYAFITDLELTGDGRLLRAGTHARAAWALGAAGPGVSVSKTVQPSAAPLTPGSLVTFNLVVANTGSTTLAHIPMDDFYDEQYLQFVSASVAPNAALPGRLEWDNLAGPPGNGFGSLLEPSDVFTMTTTFRVLACPLEQTTLNKLEVTAALDENGDVAPRASAVASARLLCASATLSKTRVGPERVALDEIVTFDITIRNTGNLTITTLPLVDTYDATALTFVSASTPPASTLPLGTLTWNNLGSLAPGATRTVTVRFRATGCPPGQTTTDTARVEGASAANPPEPPIVLPTLTASASVDIACPNLQIDKTWTPPAAGAITLGEIATLNIRITNAGNKTIRRLPLEDLFDPTHLAFESASPTPNAVGYGHVQWTDLTGAAPNGFDADLAPGASINITLRLRAIGCPPDQESVDKARIVAAIDEENNPVPTVEDTAVVRIACPEVTISKTLANPDPCGVFGPGDPVLFTVTITNTGNTTLVTLPLVDTFDPVYLQFVAATPTPNLTVPAGTLTWTDLTGPPPNGFGADLAPGQVFTVNLTFTALQSTSGLPGGVTVNRVRVEGAIDEYGFVAPTATDAVDVAIRDADLYVEKTQITEYPQVQVRDNVADTLGMSPFGTKLSNAVVTAGEIITYNIKYGNHGPDEAAFVRLVDTIPPGTVYLGHNLAPCLDRDIRDACFVGRVAPGEKREFQVWVRVPLPSEGGFSTPPGTVLTNTITIESGFTEAGPVCGTPDGTPDNNTVSYATTVLGDFGDAPLAAIDGLPGYAAQADAYSANYTHEWLGRAVSGERSATEGLDIDAEPNRGPYNTDHHDDGVFYRNPFAFGLPSSQRTYIPGERAVTARVTVSVANTDHGRYNVTPDKKLYITAWADSNRNGQFGDAGDMILLEWNGGPGLVGSDRGLWPTELAYRVMDLNIRVPGEIGWMMVRTRLNYGAPPTPGGVLDYGEIEDYLIGVFPGIAPSLIPGPAQPRPPAP